MRLIFFLTLIVAGAIAVSCSSGDRARLSHDEYLQKTREIEAGADARSATQLFFKVVTPGVPKRSCLEAARNFDRSLHNIIAAVASLRPPRAIQSLQDRFVAAATETTGEVDDAVEDVQAGALTCGRPMNRRIYTLPSTLRAEKVLDELGKKGYRIGLNSED
jgi:hypothetical protein